MAVEPSQPLKSLRIEAAVALERVDQFLPDRVGEAGVGARSRPAEHGDGDDALELVVCGKDDRGKVFAVVDVNDDGTLPEAPVRAQRSSLFQGNVPVGVNNEPARPEDACRLADLNEDGHLDLVVPGRVDDGEISAGYPNAAIHHGVGDGSFGAAHRVVWVERSLRNRPIKAFEIAEGPLAVINCQAHDVTDRACTDRFRLPLVRDGAGWQGEVRSFDRLAADDEEELLSAVVQEAPVALADSAWVAGGPLVTRQAVGGRRLRGLAPCDVFRGHGAVRRQRFSGRLQLDAVRDRHIREDTAVRTDLSGQFRRDYAVGRVRKFRRYPVQDQRRPAGICRVPPGRRLCRSDAQFRYGGNSWRQFRHEHPGGDLRALACPERRRARAGSRRCIPLRGGDGSFPASQDNRPNAASPAISVGAASVFSTTHR